MQWSWNDKLDLDLLISQLHEMNEKGIKSAFVVTRGGIVDEYLGETFMQIFTECVKEAERLGMTLWIYDEFYNSSGKSGYQTVLGHPEYSMKALICREVSADEADKCEGIVNIFDTEKDSVKRVVSTVHANKSAFVNHQSWTDVSCKEATDRFLQLTYEKYKEYVGDYFGTVVPGSFSDEPHFYMKYDLFNRSTSSKYEAKITMEDPYVLPWTRDMLPEFRKRKGYDIADTIIELFFKVGDYKKTRFDYWDVLSAVFRENFTRNVYEWCERNNLQFTGHFWEHTFPSPLHTGSTMPNYEYLHIPGIDMLFNMKTGQFGDDFIVKEVSSVANQLGKHRVMSETFGAAGWDFTFQDQKKIADWQFALGINLVDQHHLHYSLREYRKRDHPQSFIHEPWWDEYKFFADYMTRLSYVMSQGTYEADILVLHPSSSTWTEYDPCEESSEYKEIGKSVRILTKRLCELHYGFDLGDDVIIAKYGEVEADKIIVGEMDYTTVIVPSMTAMRESVFQMLQDFSSNGGNIICTGIIPSLLEGTKSEALEQFFTSEAVIQCENTYESLKQTLEQCNNKRIGICDSEGSDVGDIFFHERIDRNRRILFLCNINPEKEYTVKLSLSDNYKIEEWNPETGNIETVELYKSGGAAYTELSFAPAGSHLLVIDMDKKQNSIERKGTEKPKKILKINDWTAELTDFNAYTLNKCRTKINDKEWSREENVIDANNKMREDLGLGSISVAGVKQIWMYDRSKFKETYSVKAKYVFDVDEIPADEVYAVLESGDRYTVYINGKQVQPNGKTYKTREFMMFDITKGIHEGSNELVLETDEYNIDLSFESIYIVGNFQLTKKTDGFSLQSSKSKIQSGDICKQGYPYYSGTIKYTSAINIEPEGGGKIEFEAGDFYGNAARVYVNGRYAGFIGWRPYRVDITALVVAGENILTFELMNSMQNLLGPHSKDAVDGLATPRSFNSEKDEKFSKTGFSGQGLIRVF
jgi:hypothetical protein